MINNNNNQIIYNYIINLDFEINAIRKIQTS